MRDELAYPESIADIMASKPGTARLFTAIAVRLWRACSGWTGKSASGGWRTSCR
jgi:hypothetical protein